MVTFEPGRSSSGAESAIGTTAVLGRRLRVARSGLVLAIAAGVLLALPSVLVAGLAKTFVNKYLIDGSVQWLDAVLIAFLLAAVLQVGLSALQQTAMTRTSRKMSITMSADYLWHLLRLPISHFVARPAGDLGFLMTLNDKSATSLGRRLAMALMSVVIGLITGAFLVRFSVWLTLIVLGLTALSFIAVQLMSRKLAPIGRDLTAAQAAMSGTATGGISSIESLKAKNAPRSRCSPTGPTVTPATLELDQRMGVVNSSVNAIPNLSILLMTTAVIGVGGAQVISGAITLGDLVGFQSLLVPFLAATSSVLSSATLLRKVTSDSRKLDETDRLPIDAGIAASEVLMPTAAPAKLAGALEVRGLTFGYQPGGPSLIADLDLRLEPGTRVALVGGSGSGKSTVARLVTGQLRAMGRPDPVRRAAAACPSRRRSLAYSIAFVQQEVYLFDGTVSENLTLWDPHGPRVGRRARRPGRLHPPGDQCVPEAATRPTVAGGRPQPVSGGQRQRMEIARALARQSAAAGAGRGDQCPGLGRPRTSSMPTCGAGVAPV